MYKRQRLDSQIFVHAVDSKWVEHLTVMDNMRQSIGLEAVGQRNPLIQYKKMGFEMFAILIQGAKSQIVSDAIRISSIQNRNNEKKYTEEKKNFNFEQTRQNMSSASINSNNNQNSNLSRKERRRIERLNKKNDKKRI